MTALAALDALAREVARLFPADSPAFAVLDRYLEELRGRLVAGDDALTAVWPLLDTLDDLLECQLRRQGWPVARR